MEQFVEVKGWGFNALIIFSLFTMIFSIFQGYGFLKQSQKIWKDKSVESLSTPFFFLFFFYFIAFIFYGLHQKSLAIVFNGLLFLPCAPILIGILKFKKLNVVDWLSLCLSIAVVPIMILIKDKDVFISILMIVSLLVLLSQLLLIIKEKSSGSIEIKMMIVFFITAIFWLVYTLLIGNLVLQIFNACAILIYGIIIYLYKKYKS